MSEQTEKIERMLKFYRGRLERVTAPPADYAEAAKVEAKISVLEDLYYYFQQEEAKAARAALGGG